jgi:hypothetical protein
MNIDYMMNWYYFQLKHKVSGEVMEAEMDYILALEHQEDTQLKLEFNETDK